MKKYYPELLKKFSNIRVQLDQARELRNMFAHSNPDTSVDYLKQQQGILRLEYYKSGNKGYREFSSKDITDIRIQVGKLQKSLSSIAAIITKGETGPSEYVGNIVE